MKYLIFGRDRLQPWKGGWDDFICRTETASTCVDCDVQQTIPLRDIRPLGARFLIFTWGEEPRGGYGDLYEGYESGHEAQEAFERYAGAAEVMDERRHIQLVRLDIDEIVTEYSRTG